MQKSIKQEVNYLEVLQIDKKDGLDFSKIKNSFRSHMIKNSMKRLKRVQLNLAYEIALEKINKTQTPQILTLISIGDHVGLEKLLVNDNKILNKKIFSYPPIYFAVRSGHYDIVQLIIKMGCSIDFEGHKSTPMHCAAYYGHYQLIPLLLQYGIPTNIKNWCSHIPKQQAATKQIEQLLEGSLKDRIFEINTGLLNKKLAYTLLNITKNQKIVIKKIILNRYFDSYPKYLDAFHGSSAQNLQSIATHGLKRPGDNIGGSIIKTVLGHIQLGHQFQGKKDWAKAIFLSPSIYYSANPVYSKQIIVGSETWLPIVQAKVKPGSYSQHDHTLTFYKHTNDEPRNVEWRVETKIEQKNLIIRAELPEDVYVVALIFIKKGFLDQNPDFQQTKQIVLNSPEQKKMRSYYQKMI